MIQRVATRPRTPAFRLRPPCRARDDAHERDEEGGRQRLVPDRDREPREDGTADDERQERGRPGAAGRGRIGRQHDERADRRRHRHRSDERDGHPEPRQDHEAEQAGPQVETLTVDRQQFLGERGHHGRVGGAQPPTMSMMLVPTGMVWVAATVVGLVVTQSRSGGGLVVGWWWAGSRLP